MSATDVVAVLAFVLSLVGLVQNHRTREADKNSENVAEILPVLKNTRQLLERVQMNERRNDDSGVLNDYMLEVRDSINVTRDKVLSGALMDLYVFYVDLAETSSERVGGVTRHNGNAFEQMMDLCETALMRAGQLRRGKY